MTHTLKQYFLLLLISFSFSASACKPSGLDIEIQFNDDSASMGIKESTELVNWFFYARDHLKITEAGIFALARKGNPHSMHLAEQRLQHVERLLQTMSPASIRWNRSITEVSTRAGLEQINTIAIEAQPGCLKTKTCCPRPLTQ